MFFSPYRVRLLGEVNRDCEKSYTNVKNPLKYKNILILY